MERLGLLPRGVGRLPLPINALYLPSRHTGIASTKPLPIHPSTPPPPTVEQGHLAIPQRMGRGAHNPSSNFQSILARSCPTPHRQPKPQDAGHSSLGRRCDPLPPRSTRKTSIPLEYPIARILPFHPPDSLRGPHDVVYICTDEREGGRSKCV